MKASLLSMIIDRLFLFGRIPLKMVRSRNVVAWIFVACWFFRYLMVASLSNLIKKGGFSDCVVVRLLILWKALRGKKRTWCWLFVSCFNCSTIVGR